MKDRTREAIFNVLGPLPEETHVIDLFAGTGAMAFEAISRGAKSAVVVDPHQPTVQMLRENVKALGLEDQATIVPADVFEWFPRAASHQRTDGPWLVFCCPPYRFYEDRLPRLRQLLAEVRDLAPADSRLVVEAESPFDFARLELAGDWDVRTYRPAEVGIVDL